MAKPRRQFTPATALSDRWVSIAVSLLLGCAIWLVFGQILRHEFLNYDDDAYVYDNPAVVRGLSASGLVAAFTQTDVGLWTPLTRVSHMLVCELFGLQPWAHQLTNLLLHTATSILLFVTLKQMTGALWRSAFVAALFALHPLHVESVAWVSERKDTLSALFFVLTVFAYTRYVRQTSSGIWYVSLIALFALTLLAKPMAVTLPFVLLLLDYWPLKRVTDDGAQPSDWRPLVTEKLPLFALTGLLLWFVLFDPFGFNEPVARPFDAPLSLRLSNAVVSYGAYIWQMFYPAGLAVRYSFPLGGVPGWQAAISLVVLGSITAWGFAVRHRRPYVLIGWLWYLGMLIPVSQVVPLGTEARCDRYTYLPQIGLYIMVAWSVTDLLGSWRYRRAVAGAAAAVSLVLLATVAHAQTGYWRDSITLWKRAVAAGSPDWITYNNLGLAMTAGRRFDEAIQAFQQALRARPDDAYAENNLGIAFVGAGNLQEAARHFEEALRLKQPYAEASDNLGLIFAKQGRLDEAIRHHEAAIAAKPNFPPAYNNLGMIFAQQGKAAEAMRCYQRAIELKPNYAAAHLNLGMLFAAQGSIERALTHYETALQFDAKSIASHNNLAWVLATHPTASVRNGPRAVELARTASRLAGENDPEILDTLAAAYAEAGDYDQAVSVTTRAIELAQSKLDNGLATQLEQRRQLYLRREPYRDRR